MTHARPQPHIGHMKIYVLSEPDPLAGTMDRRPIVGNALRLPLVTYDLQ
jgi:hypothetical protein